MLPGQRALLAAMSGYAMDGFDIIMLSFILPQITQALHLTSAQGGSLITWTLIGGALGGIGFGIAGDYIGRARVLSLSVLIFSFFTFLCAFSQGFADLFVYRICAGVGLGCEFGVGMALVTEYFPVSMRGRVASWVGMSWQFGVLAATLLTPFLLPYVGWRGMFVVGGLPAVIAWFIRRSVQEPEVFKSRGRQKDDTFPLWSLFKGWEMTRRSIAILSMSTIQNFGYYGLMIWLPSYLISQFHLSLHLSGVWTAVSVCGMILGVWVFGQAADRIGLKPAFLLWQCLATLTVGLYALMATPSLLLVAGFVAGVFVNGMMGGYGALITELYPTAIRSTAQNVLWSVGRALGGFGPAVLGLVLGHTSFGHALLFLSAIYILDFLIVAFLVPSNLRKLTSQITQEDLVL